MKPDTFKGVWLFHFVEKFDYPKVLRDKIFHSCIREKKKICDSFCDNFVTNSVTKVPDNVQ